jgi:hypothetical protein
MKRQLGFLGMLLTCSLAACAAEPWSLERALDYAQAHNPTRASQQQRIAAAQAGLEQANSAFWPRLQAQSGYTRTDNPMMVFAQHSEPTGLTLFARLQRRSRCGQPQRARHRSVPLYAGGRNVAGRQAAKRTPRPRSKESAAVRNALGFVGRARVHTVLKTRQFIRATERR